MFSFASDMDIALCNADEEAIFDAYAKNPDFGCDKEFINFLVEQIKEHKNRVFSSCMEQYSQYQCNNVEGSCMSANFEDRVKRAEKEQANSQVEPAQFICHVIPKKNKHNAGENEK